MLTLSEERKFHHIFAHGSESSRERKFLGTRVQGNESTRERKFHVWNFRSWERKYVGTKVPVTVTNESVPLLTYTSVDDQCTVSLRHSDCPSAKTVILIEKCKTNETVKLYQISSIQTNKLTLC